MASLTKIVGQIAHVHNKENDANFKLVIRDLVIQQWNLLIRRSIERNGIDAGIVLPLYSDVVFVSPTTDDIVTSNGVYRTALKIPPPVRYKSDAPFMLVADSITNAPFAYSRRWESQFRSTLPFISTNNVYDYLNGYIYILSTATPLGTFTSASSLNLFIKYVSSDPDTTIDMLYADRGIGWEEDTAFPYSNDLVNDILNILAKSGNQPTSQSDNE